MLTRAAYVIIAIIKRYPSNCAHYVDCIAYTRIRVINITELTNVLCTPNDITTKHIVHTVTDWLVTTSPTTIVLVVPSWNSFIRLFIERMKEIIFRLEFNVSGVFAVPGDKNDITDFPTRWYTSLVRIDSYEINKIDCSCPGSSCTALLYYANTTGEIKRDWHRNHVTAVFKRSVGFTWHFSKRKHPLLFKNKISVVFHVRTTTFELLNMLKT